MSTSSTELPLIGLLRTSEKPKKAPLRNDVSNYDQLRTLANFNRSARVNAPGLALGKVGCQFVVRSMEPSLRLMSPTSTSATIVEPTGPRRCPPPREAASARM